MDYGVGRQGLQAPDVLFQREEERVQKEPELSPAHA